MSKVMAGPHIYTEREASEALVRARELQQMGGSEFAPGYSAAELRRIGAEAGIEPEFVNKAMSEVRRSSKRRWRLFTIEPTEKIVGVELRPVDFEAIPYLVASVHKEGFDVENGRLVGDVWLKPGVANLTIESRGGRTAVRAVPDVTSCWATPAFFLPVMVMFMLRGASAPVVSSLGVLGLLAVSAVVYYRLQRGLAQSEALVQRLSESLTKLHDLPVEGDLEAVPSQA